ncbi:MAG: S-layer homology domain-containing protein [Clostridia bacterium]|nr:S-layer homology domain-containing protein [Clostridia bacterium]
MNGNKMTRLIAVVVCAFMLIQCTAIAAFAADIAPEAVVYVRPEVTDVVANQVGNNYVYVDIVTENCDNDQTVMVYMLDAAGELVTVGYAPVGSNKAEVKLGAPDDADTGTYTLVTALNKAADVFKSEVFYIGVDDVNGFFEAINLTDVEASVVEEKLDATYNALSVIECTEDEDGNVILKLTGKDYEALTDDAKELFAELILSGVDGEFLPGKGSYTAENSEDFVKEAYIVAAYNAGGISDEKMAEFIYNFASVIGFDAEDENLYGKIQDKDTLAKVVKTIAEEVTNVDGLAEALEKAAAVQLVNETHWLNLVATVKANNDIFEVDEEEIEELEDTKKLRTLFCDEFKGTYYSVEEIQEAWEDAYDEAEKAYKKATSDRGSSGGGGGGGTVIKTAEVSTQLSQDENNKDPNVEIKDYYTDVAGTQYDWASDAILNLSKNQILLGYGDKTFGPEKSVTRAEFMKMIINVLGMADVTATCSFTDVDPNAWYYIYVASAEKLGLAQGYGNGLFGVNDTVTRQDAITVVYRAAKLKGLSLDKFKASTAVFEDRGEIASYAVEAVDSLYNAGVYLDTSAPLKKFEPTKNASRAYLAYVLDQIYRYMK